MISGCPQLGSSTATFTNPCDNDPTLAGCSGGTGSGAGTLNTDNAAIVLSSSLHDILNITQVMLAAAVKSHEYRTEIEQVNSQGQSNNQGQMTDQGQVSGLNIPDLPCDIAPNTYTIDIQFALPGYPQEGTTVTINFGGYTGRRDAYDTNGNLIPAVTDAEAYCRLGNINISGVMNITRIDFALPDPALPESWAMDAEIWPTLTIHHDPTPDNYMASDDAIADLTDITNPIHITATYTQTVGLTLAATVMDNPFCNEPPCNINGMVFTHYKAGDNANTVSNSSILRTGSTITTEVDSADPQLDPLNASRWSISVDGGIVSDRTGTDIDMPVQTVDSSASSQPLTWQGTNSVNDAPESQPPTSGAMTISDIGTGNSITGTITSNQGDMNLLITDNTVSPPQTSLPTHWHVMMMLH